MAGKERLEATGLDGRLSVTRPTTTLRTQALDKLRAAIIDGHLPPGTRLVERRLCELLGVSRTLVREALRQLEAEGWVQNPPYKGPTVTPMGADDARELYEMRGALEGLAARLCAERATEADIARLVQAVDDMERADKAGDVPAHVLAVNRFYAAILGAAGNAMLKAALDAQHGRLAWLRTLSLGQPERGAASVAEKRMMLLAIQARDGAAARAASEFHVQQAARVAAAAVAETPAGDP